MSTFVIAEIGINHNGDLGLAKQMIRMAKEAGCDAVKFQKRTIDIVYTQEFLDSYRESPWGTTQRAQKEGLEFGLEEYREIDRYCKKVCIEWFASAWDTKAMEFLRGFDCKYNKVASAMLTNLPLLNMIADEKKKTFISTGMSTLEEIANAVAIFREKGCSFELMHCNSTYPMAEGDSNLNVIDMLRERFGCDVGYSGHEMGKLVSICAVAHGATSIERHITLDRMMYGSDQKASIEIDELKELVALIRIVELINGAAEKSIGEKEMAVRKKLRG